MGCVFSKKTEDLRQSYYIQLLEYYFKFDKIILSNKEDIKNEISEVLYYIDVYSISRLQNILEGFDSVYTRLQ